MKKHIKIDEKEKHKSLIPDDCLEQEIPYLEKWLSIGAKPFHFDGSYCLIREVEYPIQNIHGLYAFSECEKIVSKWNESPFSHPLSALGHTAQDLFFFDTETTGLGGGVGNTIFLLGYARVLKNKVVVKQHFLPSPGSEIALYQSFLQDVNYSTLVTYNGKAFDWPQVKTRHTLIRDSVPRLPQFGHFDLYHAARRLWKDSLEQVRLATVEKEILGIERKSDTPGYLAPMLYFDFLQHQNPEGLFGIFKHNEIDVLSLITLYIHLSKVILHASSYSNKEQYEIARWFESLGEKQRAILLYEKLTKSDTIQTAKAKKNLAYIYKEEKEFSKAMSLFKEVFESTDKHIKTEAAIEIAKILEHHQKDYGEALTYACAAFDEWKQIEFKQNKFQENDFSKRINRLENKGKKF